MCVHKASVKHSEHGAAEHLPDMCEALGSLFNTAKQRLASAGVLYTPGVPAKDSAEVTEGLIILSLVPPEKPAPVQNKHSSKTTLLRAGADEPRSHHLQQQRKRRDSDHRSTLCNAQPRMM